MSRTPFSIPLDYVYTPVAKPVRAYHRRDGRRTYLYHFEYSIEGVFTESPFSVEVRSINLTAATDLARWRIARTIKQEYESYSRLKWHLYPGVHITRPRRQPRPDFAHMVRPIIDVIDKAPPITDLFKPPLS